MKTKAQGEDGTALLLISCAVLAGVVVWIVCGLMGLV